MEQRGAIGGATYIYAIYMPKKRSYRSISEQEEPSEEQMQQTEPSKPQRKKTAIGSRIGHKRVIC